MLSQTDVRENRHVIYTQACRQLSNSLAINESLALSQSDRNDRVQIAAGFDQGKSLQNLAV